MKQPPDEDIIKDKISLKEYAKQSFYYFLEQIFSIVNPGENFLPNWHIRMLASYLQEVSQGNIKRLIINLPPRSLKSICVSVAWPAWLLGHNASKKIIVASYNHHLSYKHALDCRHLMRSSYYQDLFPETLISIEQNQKSKFLTNKRGYRFATSVGGTATGEGGNILIIDDPHNALHVNSQVKRQNVQRWFQQSFASRLDNKKTGRIILVMQRLHCDDLTGFLLENYPKAWYQFSIPAIAQQDIYYNTKEFEYHFKKGELLHSNREGIAEIERAKMDLGSTTFAAQYLQQPIGQDIGMLKSEWFGYYDPGALPEFLTIVLSWDTAIKTGVDHSYSVCTCWGETQSSFYLLEVIRQKLEYPELKRMIIATAMKWQPLVTLIEDKASGQTLLQDLQNETNLAMLGVKVSKDKVTRFARITPLFEAGRVLLHKTALWRFDYETELLLFPHGAYNDQADSTSQYFNYIFNRRVIKPRLRHF